MALSVKQDPEQWAQLIQTINDLSTNIGKQEALTRKTIESGFSALVSGTTEEQQQALVDQIATALNLTADEVQAALKQSTTVEGE